MNFGATANPFAQTTSIHTHGQQPVQGMDMLALIQAMLQSQQSQGTMRGAQQREARVPVHRDMSGGIIDPTTGKTAGNPFDNGFFLGGQARAGREQQILGGNKDGVFDPNGGHFGQTGMQLQNTMPPVPPQPQQPLPPPTPVGYGMQPPIPPAKPKPARLGGSFGFSMPPRPGVF